MNLRLITLNSEAKGHTLLPQSEAKVPKIRYMHFCLMLSRSMKLDDGACVPQSSERSCSENRDRSINRFRYGSAIKVTVTLIAASKGFLYQHREITRSVVSQ